MNRLKLTFVLLILLLTTSGPAWARDSVQGYRKPKICLESNIRCILRNFGGTKYWCLKSQIQRQLDARRTSSPLTKTTRQNMGNCAKLIPIDDYPKE